MTAVRIGIDRYPAIGDGGANAMSKTTMTDIVEHVAPGGFDDTLNRLIDAIGKAGLILFARIDHAAGARDAGLSMPPSTVLIYGHPKGGTPLMLAAPLAALDLPLRALVREREDGRTVIAFHPAGPMLLRANVPEALASRLDAAQRILLETLAP